MEFFKDVHSVRLLTQNGKYLWAAEDRNSVALRRGENTYGVDWRVEVVPERNTIRLKSVYDLYLKPSDYASALGFTGRKIRQSFASKADSSLEWEPVRSDSCVKFTAKGDKFLRANGGVPPYRNTVTYDVPMRKSKQHEVLWTVVVVKLKDPLRLQLKNSPLASPTLYNAAKLKLSPPRISKVEISDHDQYSPPEPVRRPQLPRNPEPGVKYPPTSHHSSCSEWSSPPASPPSRRRPTKTPEPSKDVPKPKQSELRRIYYSVAEDNGEVLAHDDETSGTLLFEGSTIDELAHELQRMTGIDDIILCMKNPLSTKLYKMRLPANRAPLCVVIVRQNSRFGKAFSMKSIQ
ncbi:uncharacterized protein [Physcomitrium patens]|uniref:DUF569 domain-containing protein n=1 Tax=Physcomitrium patens TaxID=3218 RepID=A0A2K1JUR0_PHYPA|nr:uncharacterized protein LOC112288444 [Physcomitrium patens]XP_024388379.1 uncharacterized protein LOC112288444 [Physcomitrium patens]XP_024388380.1 uncharacterized protein LOC112288444 [Physcomitrium patens]XP_024388381.1 uncharacterized protein LOC112288444 [Physcomitrium patens]PNR45256.1 hypothetical protein PHYPA_015027 [Physcomitrium patens]|eukprot:XP_024388378.1 uncharacterized protein LOC112288444 [Physcomitrella patens]